MEILPGFYTHNIGSQKSKSDDSIVYISNLKFFYLLITFLVPIRSFF